MQYKIIKNSGANLLNRFWTILINIVFIPVYIRFLGLDAYGLVTFFVTLQIVLDLLGVGLSKTLRREFAHDSSTKDINYKYLILRSVETVYVIIATVILFICIFSADYISGKWLSSNILAPEIIRNCIKLMGFCIAFQLLANLYLGCYFGLEKQVQANVHQVIWSFTKNIGILIVFLCVNPSIILFFLWFAICDFAYLIINRSRLIIIINKLGRKTKWRISDITLIKGIMNYAFGIMLISIGYCINTQVDKIIISQKFNLATVGAYNTTYSLSLFTTILCTAVGIAVFPRFTKYYGLGQKTELNEMFKKVNLFVSFVTIVIGSFLAVYSSEIIDIWTGSKQISEIMCYGPIFIILGTLFVALQEIPYNYFLSVGMTKPNNIQVIFCISFVLILTPFIIDQYGILGASLAWFINMGIATLIYLIYFYLKFFGKKGIYILLYSNILPIIVSLLIAFLSYKIYTLVFESSWLIIGLGALTGIMEVLVFILIYRQYLKSNELPFKYYYSNKR